AARNGTSPGTGTRTAADPAAPGSGAVGEVDDVVFGRRFTGLLGGVVAGQRDVREVVVADGARHVLAGEARGVELADLRVAGAARLHEVVQVLVDQPVRADGPGHLLLRAAEGDELVLRGDVDAVHVGIAHRRRRGGEVDLAG